MDSPQKICAVCLDTEPEDVEAWVRPCLCPVWVHQDCLVCLIQDLEIQHPVMKFTYQCNICNTHYTVIPEQGPVVGILASIDTVVYLHICRVAGAVCAVTTALATATTYGQLVILHVYGKEEVNDLLLSLGPGRALGVCISITLCAIIIDYTPWEDTVLRVLRRCSRVPFLGRIFPTEHPNVKEVKDKSTCCSLIAGGLLLPVFSKITGEVLFGSVESKMNRFLLGGVVFLSMRGIFTMYHKQKVYMRQSAVSIANYSPDNDNLLGSE